MSLERVRGYSFAEYIEIYAEVVKNKSIRVVGELWDSKFDLTFNVGDEVVYDSWNLTYIGEIVSIGKTVSVKTCRGVKRMPIHDFINKNHKLDLESVRADNAETSRYI